MKQTAWPDISLDRSARAPTLRQQIASRLAAAIREGTLPSGCLLPSSRMMSKVLNVSRGTVVDAYEALVSAGVLVGDAGSGMRVAHEAPSVPNLGNLKKTAIAAHYPTRILRFDDRDGTPLYFNLVGS